SLRTWKSTAVTVQAIRLCAHRVPLTSVTAPGRRSQKAVLGAMLQTAKGAVEPASNEMSATLLSAFLLRTASLQSQLGVPYRLLAERLWRCSYPWSDREFNERGLPDETGVVVFEAGVLVIGTDCSIERLCARRRSSRHG